MKLNVMDNQASWVITKFLTTKKCNNLLVEPNNHRVNVAERAIKSFKMHFISASWQPTASSPPSVVGQINTTSRDNPQHVTLITTWSHNVSIWSYPRSIRLEPFFPCPSWLQGCDIQSPWITRILGQQRHWHMVHQAIDEPLPLQPFFHLWDSSLPCLRIRRVIPTTLSSAVPNVKRAPPGSLMNSLQLYMCSHWRKGAGF
jgi:hypothetical protein